MSSINQTPLLFSHHFASSALSGADRCKPALRQQAEPITIELLDGSNLPCFPSANSEKPYSSELALDPGGEYLSASHKALFHKRPTPEDMAKPFLCNISLFLAHQGAILTDSRLFLSPVPVNNGLAYTGISGFQHPTLGVYIEWWHHFYKESHDRMGNPLWFISGSPLSGRHACSSVKPNGKTTNRCVLNMSFRNTWRSFLEVNGRYAEAKARCEAYTLQQAVDYIKEL